MIRLLYSPRIRVAASGAILIPLTIGSLLSLIGDFSRERIFLNRTHSLSRGVYMASDKTNIEKGDLVILPVPMKMKAFQEASTWLSPVKNLLKMVVGTTGDRFCFRNGHLEIGGGLYLVSKQDHQGKKLPVLEGCNLVGWGEVFVLGKSDDSFDSRYFGPVLESEIKKVVKPLIVF